MPTYITLIHYTEQGVQTFKDLAHRIEETKAAGEAVGAKLVGYYLTMGQYDAVAISEAPDDHTIAKLALAAGARGNVRTETMRAFTGEEALALASEL
jgi:uncharacterized protein with GYD domain